MPLIQHRFAAILQRLCPETATTLRIFTGTIVSAGERRHKLGKIEAIRHNVRDLVGTRARHRIAFVRIEDVRAVVSRTAGALVRAVLVMMMVATPSVILPGVDADTKQMVALVALFGGVLTFAEYNSAYPSMIEFRDAPPFNRIRFIMLFVIVFALSVITAADAGASSFSRLFAAVGYLIGAALDFPYSPVRLVLSMLSADAHPAQVAALRTAAGTAYLLSLLSMTFFVLILKLKGWPSRNQVFNVWVNLPTFEPTAGGDVVERLERDAWINLSLGFLLPFMIPAAVSVGANGLVSVPLASPQTLIWTMAAWAFLPASLLMRGVAMGRVAAMIREKRDGQAQPAARRGAPLTV